MPDIPIQDVLLAIMVIIGLVGTILPAMPGTAIILAGALVHSLYSGFIPLGISTLAALTLLCLTGSAGQYLLSALGSKKMGGSRYGVIGASLGMLAGLLLPIPGGIFIGTLIGAVLMESYYGGNDLRQATKAGFGALLGTIASLFWEFIIGLIMAGLIFYLLFSSS